jgi:hypothetical protein
MVVEDPRDGRRGLAQQSARCRRPYWDLYQAVIRGALPALRVGGRWYVADRDADAFLEGQRRAQQEAGP